MAKVNSMRTEVSSGFSFGGGDCFGEHGPKLGCFVYKVCESVRRERLSFGE